MNRPLRIAVALAAVAIGAAPRVSAQGMTMQQCAAETDQRHKDVVTSMQGKPAHEIAHALVESDAKGPSMAECARGGRSGAATDDVVPADMDNSTSNAELDTATAAANASADAKPPEGTSHPARTAVLVGAGASVLFGIKIIDSSDQPHPGGGTPTPGGGGTTPNPVFDPLGFIGFWVGEMNPQPDFAPTSNAQCPNAKAYSERVTVSLNANGAGTITLDDTPGFQRAYPVSGVTALNKTVTAQATFAFAGLSVPGTAAFTFASQTQMTVRETTNFGTCASTYAGTLTKQ